MNKYGNYLVVFVLIILLILVRAFESKLFYDPLIAYFKNDYLHKPMPKLDNWKLVVDLFLRYSINSLLTIGVIWFLFKKKDILKFSGFFLMTAFMILILVFFFLMRDEFNSGYLLPFYVRRFLIHPLFLLLLLPAFYYQRLQNKQIKSSFK